MSKYVATALMVLAAAVIGGPAAGASPSISVVATIPGGGSGITASGGYVYVAELGGLDGRTLLPGFVRVISEQTNAVVASVTVGGAPAGVAVSGDYLYVANNNLANNTSVPGSVSVVDIHDPTAPSVVATIQDPLIFAPGAVSVANGYVYVGDCDGLATAVINTLTNTVVGTVDLANQCNSSMSLVGNELYAVSGDHVAVVDADPLSQSFDAVVQTIPLTTPPGGTTPRATTLVASGSSVYVADVENFLFDVIDSGTRSVVATIPDPSGANDAQSMATAEGYVYVSYDYPGTVEVLDTHANTVAGVVGPLGDFQDNIAAEGQNAYASGNSDPSVTVIHVENPAAGPYVPLQAYGITADGRCGKDVPDSVNWPGIASQQSAGWSKSWQQWPNNGTGGFVCQRQVYYTTTGMSVR